MTEASIIRNPDENQARPPAPSSSTATTTKVMRTPHRLIGRERLIAQLVDARRKRCIVMQSPAGYGKTTALLAWREALYPLGFQVAWLSLDARHDELAVFLDALAASLARVDPSITRDAALLGGRGLDDEALERTVIALVHSIAERQGELVLVLDDLHRLGSSRAHQCLQWLLDYAPPNLHLAIASRGAIPLSLGRMRDAGLLLELDLHDLRLSMAESEAFVKAQTPAISMRDARRIHEMTDGWITGLQLMLVGTKCRKSLRERRDKPTEFLAMQALDLHTFAEYFEREVLSLLDVGEIELLVRMSICERICAPLCIALSADASHPDGVLRLLARLESDSLFLVPAGRDGHHAWYRLNPLFREMLNERFLKCDESRRQVVHRAAWHWFRDHDHADEAVRHALLCGEPAAAADLVQNIARGLQLSGELRKVVGLMHLLPKAEIDARTGLRLWRIHLHLYAREFDACAVAIAQLRAELAPDDHHSHFRLTLLQSALAVQRDDLDGASALLPALRSMPAEVQGIAAGACNNLLSWLHARRGEFDAAREVQRTRVPMLPDGTPVMGTSAGILSGRALVAFSHLLEGNMSKVEHVCRDVLFEAEQRGSAAAEAAALAAALLGEVLYESGDAQQARMLLENQLDVIERVSFPDAVASVLGVLSSSHWLAEHRLDATACLDRLEEYALRYDLPRVLALCLVQRARRDAQCGHVDAVRTHLARLEELAAGCNARSLIHAELQLAVQQGLADWRIANGDDSGAVQTLATLIDLCRAHGWQRRQTGFEMQKAAALARRGDDEAAHALTLSALRRGHRLGLARTLLDADADVLALIDRVTAGEAQDPLLQFYVQRLHEAHRRAVETPAGSMMSGSRAGDTQAHETLSARESTVLNLLAQALPNKKIAKTMDISPETVKWHLKNIYGKLGVSCRDEAVARLRDLALDKQE
jgi:LuxR family transcriptional regulator, maltose regulon positive regulatory protein